MKVGCIYIITGVSMSFTYLFLTREGHLDDVCHVFAYLAQHHNARVMFDPTYPAVDVCAFVKTDWKSMYGGVKDLIPYDAPTP
jgi:hypothetical protein